MEGKMEQGPSLNVRQLSLADVPNYVSMFSNQVQDALRDTTRQGEEQYLKDRLVHTYDQELFFYGIFLDDFLIGAIEIRDEYAYRGQLYCWIHERYWGKGYFHRALNQALQLYFFHTKKTYIDAYVYAHNKRSYRALKKAGFMDAGITYGAHGKQYYLIKKHSK